MTDYQKWFDESTHAAPTNLSAVGARRRAELKSELQGAVVQRRRRRQVTRVAAAAALLGSLAWWITGVGTPARPAPADPRHVATAETDPPRIETEIVRDDPDVVARYLAAADTVPADVWIDDDQLLQLLHEHGRHTGLMRSGGRVELTDDITDKLGE